MADADAEGWPAAGGQPQWPGADGTPPAAGDPSLPAAQRASTDSAERGDVRRHLYDGGGRWKSNQQETAEALARQRRRASAAASRRQLFQCLGYTSISVAVFGALVAVAGNLVPERNYPATIGGGCAVLACIVSILHICEHLCVFTDPDTQVRTVRVLFMVPVYATTSWVGIMLPVKVGRYLDVIRDVYEAYAVYNFYMLMIVLLGGIDECVRQCMAEGTTVSFTHPFPCCCLRGWHFTMTALRNITFCVLQFMVVKPFLTLIVLILDLAGEYGDPRFHDWGSGYIYCTILYNLSIGMAFTALVYFAVATHERLLAHSPLLKFSCIKGIVFLSFWQGVAIDFLHASGNLPIIEMYADEEHTQAGLQDFLVCMEMAFFAMLHKFAFPSAGPAAALRAGAVPPRMAQALGSALRQDDLSRDFSDAWQWAKTLQIRRHKGDAAPTRCHDAAAAPAKRTRGAEGTGDGLLV